MIATQMENSKAGTSVFVGRQPIFDRQKNVFGYELLYRSSGQTNAYVHDDGEQASRRVIHSSLNVIGLSELTGHKKAFINFTRKLLISAEYEVLSPGSCVIELLETVEPDAEILSACQAAKDAGYLLALDDFVFSAKYEPLLALADILKIDFLACDRATRKSIADQFGGRNMLLLAEKIEKHEDFNEALELGYSYFQGYFFCKPQIISQADIPAFKQNYLRFIQAVNAPALNFDQLEDVVKHDIALSTKLLRYLNSSSMGMSHTISSIKQALTLLGEKPLRRWASLVALAALGEDKPTELVLTALVRARFCELLATTLGLAGRELDLFLMGLLSALDALTDRPLSEVITQIPLPHDLTAALLGANNTFSRALGLAQAFERGIPARLSAVLAQLKLPLEQTSEVYQQAVIWADASMKF